MEQIDLIQKRKKQLLTKMGSFQQRENVSCDSFYKTLIICVTAVMEYTASKLTRCFITALKQ